MSGEFTWSTLRPEDNHDLSRFVCSPPPPNTVRAKHRKLVGATWEREVQGGIRNLHAPLPSTDGSLVARDTYGVAAVSWWFEVGGPAQVKLLAMGVALRLRRTDAHLGDQLMTRTLDTITGKADAAGEPFVMVWGLAAVQNKDSQALLTRNGFFYTNDNERGLQEWWLRIDISI